GLFNKYDLKCHMNMNLETKKANLRLSGIKQVSFSKEELAVQRKNKRNLNKRDNKKQVNKKHAIFGEIEADILFKNLFNK
ncbi:21507_t:CDS:1, partial [Dentiscutata erythropus]